MSHIERKDMVSRDHKVLCLSKHCQLLSISRGSLYYQAVGETVENMLVMRRMDELFMLYQRWSHFVGQICGDVKLCYVV